MRILGLADGLSEEKIEFTGKLNNRANWLFQFAPERASRRDGMPARRFVTSAFFIHPRDEVPVGLPLPFRASATAHPLRSQPTRTEVDNDSENRMPEPRPEDALQFQPEWSRVNLAGIGDAVITTDTKGRVTSLNSLAETLTGWTKAEAVNVPLETIFKIVHPETRQALESPAVRALRDGVNVGLTDHTLLIAKDGKERSIGPVDDIATPIRNDRGELAGTVLVFRDVSNLYIQERKVRTALAYADNIIETLREPFLVLDTNLRVKSANRSFYRNFHVTPEETQGRFIFDLGKALTCPP